MNILTALLVLLLTTPLAAAPLANSGLDADADGNGVPDSWNRYCEPRPAAVAYTIDRAVYRSAPGACKLNATAGGRGTLSALVPVLPGKEYAFRVWTRTQFPAQGVAHIYLGWQTDSHAAVGNTIISEKISGNSDWTPLTVSSIAPEQARYAHLVMVAGMGDAGAAWFDDAEFLPAAAITPYLSNRVPGPLDVPCRPAEGSAPRRNPPAFTWLPEAGAATYNLQCSPTVAFPDTSTQTYTGIPLNCFNPPRTLSPGRWYWRYQAVSATGKCSNWSQPHTFTITPAAWAFPVPPLPELAARIPAGHPRLFVTARALAAFRARRLGTAKKAWESLESAVRTAIGHPLPAEPAPYKDGKWEVSQWRRIWNTGANAASQIENQAFAYLVSGDPVYAAEARRWMLHVCAWDPAGTTSQRYNDSASRPLLTSMARAYDWIYDTLSPAERERILAVLRVRGNEMYAILRQHRMEYKPYDSHLISALEFMGEVSLALYGDLPEAKAWFDYAIPVHLALFPPWGDDDGGWSQGVSYWKWSTSQSLLYADALRSALSLDVFQKPWYHNTGYFKLYCHPPYSRMSAFGDHSDVPPDGTDKMNMERLSAVYHNGAFKWYADSVIGTYGGIPAYLWAGDTTAPRPPADLPQSRLFADVGIAALHTRLWDPANNVSLLLKSSPYGSWNHGYAEQNNFVLDAFGEPLIVSSGYYPWYMSPHHKEWTHQSKAQNCILVNGEGQPIQDKSAVGKIVALHAGSGFDYVVGDASAAYAGKMKRWLRHVTFVRPDFFVLLDDAEAPTPSSFQWMLHSLEKMDVQAAEQTAILQRGKSRLRARWLAPDHLSFAQTDQFPIAPEEREAHKPNQWHLTVAAAEPSARRLFLTVLQPYRVGSESRLPGCRRLEATGALGTRVGQDLVGFRTTASAGIVTLDGVRSDGAAFAVRRAKSGVVTGFFLANGSTLSLRTEQYLVLPPGSSASCSGEGSSLRATLDLSASGTVRLRLPAAPKRVCLDGKLLLPGKWSYQPRTYLLMLFLSRGSHQLTVNEAAVAQPAAPVVTLSTGARTPLRVLRTSAGSWLAYGSVPLTVGPYQVDSVAPASARIGGKPLTPNTIIWAGGETNITLEGKSLPRRVSLMPIPLGKPATTTTIPMQTITASEIVPLEAENFSGQSGGSAQVYTTRRFLSGGSGVSEWQTPGHTLEWQVRAPRSGRYRLLIKAAVWQSNTQRLLSLDGQTAKPWQPLTFPVSGGYGARPEEWTLYQLPEPIPLKEGIHRLSLTALSGPMNVDLLALQPAE